MNSIFLINSLITTFTLITFVLLLLIATLNNFILLIVAIFSMFVIITTFLFILGFTYVAPLFLIIYGGSILVLFFIVVQLNGITSYSLWFPKLNFKNYLINNKFVYSNLIIKPSIFKELYFKYWNNYFLNNFTFLVLFFILLSGQYFFISSHVSLIKIFAKSGKTPKEIEELIGYISYLYDFNNITQDKNLFSYQDYYNNNNNYWALTPKNNYWNNFITPPTRSIGFFNQNLWSYFDTSKGSMPLTYFMYEYKKLIRIKQNKNFFNSTLSTYDHFDYSKNIHYTSGIDNYYTTAKFIYTFDFSNINLTSFLYSTTITNGLLTLLIAFILLFTLYYSIKLLKTSYKIYY